MDEDVSGCTLDTPLIHCAHCGELIGKCDDHKYLSEQISHPRIPDPDLDLLDVTKVSVFDALEEVGVVRGIKLISIGGWLDPNEVCMCGTCEQLLSNLFGSYRSFILNSRIRNDKCSDSGQPQVTTMYIDKSTQTDFTTTENGSIAHELPVRIENIKSEYDCGTYEHEDSWEDASGFEESTVNETRSDGIHVASRKRSIPELDPEDQNTCVECGKSFRSSWHCTRHMIVHRKKRNKAHQLVKFDKTPDHSKRTSQGQETGAIGHDQSQLEARFSLRKKAVVNYKELESGMKIGTTEASDNDSSESEGDGDGYERNENDDNDYSDNPDEGDDDYEVGKPVPVKTKQVKVTNSSNVTNAGPVKSKSPSCPKPKPSPKMKNKQPKQPKEFACTVEGCTRKFTRTRLWKIHQNTHLPHEAKIRPFKCPRPGCEKTFTTATALRSHDLVHSAAKDHLCPECGKEFKRAGSLQAHMLDHGNESKFKCKDCGKEFGTIYAMRSHSRVHSDLRPYICEICGHASKSKMNLTKHMIRHNTEPSHRCPVPPCTSTFGYKNNLIAHMVQIHKLDREKVKRHLNHPESEQLFD